LLGQTAGLLTGRTAGAASNAGLLRKANAFPPATVFARTRPYSLPAVPPTPHDPGTGLELGDRRFALPALNVCEVVRAVAILALPKAPSIVEGVTNVRGTILPALDFQRIHLKPYRLHALARAGRRVLDA